MNYLTIKIRIKTIEYSVALNSVWTYKYTNVIALDAKYKMQNKWHLQTNEANFSFHFYLSIFIIKSLY